jgi:uncharacterized protein YyaL (SSP411 family)
MNRLQHETSPYLLQHAHNPVDWYAWKPEAFERAKAEDKPILVSIGYSTCHWCHVMERESFEDEAVAAFMNAHFINIKVDREERPDVDQIYMEACQLISGGGGWPLNAFLLPDGRPFFAGTYYPPESKYNRPAWIQVLQNLAEAYRDKREVVEEQATRLTEMIKGSDQAFFRESVLQEAEEMAFSAKMLDGIFEQLQHKFDKEEGGFGSAPKFPGAMALQFLLDYHFYQKTPEALDHTIFSAEKMVRGGIYDQLGGGFARYATDKAWLVPHFEKMLYDNALLITLLSNLYKITKKPLFAQAIRDTLAFVKRELWDGDGGFYSALDADSEGVEGKFYVWRKEEIEAVLGEDHGLFCAFYDVTREGNWEGVNILWQPEGLEAFAERHKKEPGKLHQQFAAQREQLLRARAKRIRPGLDDKVLLDWNALMCSAFVKAWEALGDPSYKETAIQNMAYLLDNFAQAEQPALYHTYKEGVAQYDAFLNDYANLIAALLDVYQMTGDWSYLKKARIFTDFVLAEFLDTEQNLFYFTRANQTDIPLRKKECYDSAVPSGNATMSHNLWRLGILLDKTNYRTLADAMLEKMSKVVVQYPNSFARWASGMINMVFAPPEVAIVGPAAQEKQEALLSEFIPNLVTMASVGERADFPLLADKRVEGDTKIYVCQNYSCQLPVQTIEEALTSIRPDSK